MCVGHDHSSQGIEGQGQMSRLGLGSEFETRSVGSRSSVENSFLVDRADKRSNDKVAELSSANCVYISQWQDQHGSACQYDCIFYIV